jgi:hypothetical protein
LPLATTWENGVTSGRLPETLLERESPQPDCYARENAGVVLSGRTSNREFRENLQAFYQGK